MNSPLAAGQLPDEKQDLLRKANRLQWLTLAHVTAAGVVLYLALANSQAMKGAWLDDLVYHLPRTSSRPVTTGDGPTSASPMAITAPSRSHSSGLRSP